MRLLSFVIAAAFFAGVIVAWIVRTYLISPVLIMGEWFVLRYAENPGIAFGVRLPSPFQEVLITGALAMVGFVAIRATTTLSRIAYGLVVGGALANVVDRCIDGTVTDYIAIGSFPVFNVPDSCISVGVALLLVECLYLFHKDIVKL